MKEPVFDDGSDSISSVSNYSREVGLAEAIVAGGKTEATRLALPKRAV